MNTRIYTLLGLLLVSLGTIHAATAADCIVPAPDVVTAAVLRAHPTTGSDRVGALKPGQSLPLMASQASWYQTQQPNGTTAFVSKRWTNIAACPPPPSATPSPPPPPSPVPTAETTAGPVPLLAKGHSVVWWFVFKFNSNKFPGCGNNQPRPQTCPFGGASQTYPDGQQFVFASSESPQLAQGTGCVGTTEQDPVGATYDEIYNGRFNYITWNDQFGGDPNVNGAGHSKGIVAWDDSGNATVMQVTTPGWPGAGNQAHPRQTDGNTLGCLIHDNVMFSQHFFALKLTKDDLIKLLRALQNASVATAPTNPQIVSNAGPPDVQTLVTQLGQASDSTTPTLETLSSGVRLISKPASLNVPPWHLVSSLLGALPLRTASWWVNPDKIPDTTSDTQIDCWNANLSKPGAVESSATGIWHGTQFALTGGSSNGLGNGNHAKVAVSLEPATPLAIFADMNQEGALTPADDATTHCKAHQNGRGGLFFVLQNAALTTSITALITLTQ
jgi:hypothetical protein